MIKKNWSTKNSAEIAKHHYLPTPGKTVKEQTQGTRQINLRSYPPERPRTGNHHCILSMSPLDFLQAKNQHQQKPHPQHIHFKPNMNNKNLTSISSKSNPAFRKHISYPVDYGSSWKFTLNERKLILETSHFPLVTMIVGGRIC